MLPVTFHWPFGEMQYLFDWPVGSDEERAAAINGLPVHWENTNGYAALYEISPDVWNWHDGVDLNLNFPSHNLDYNYKLKAIGNGKIIFMGNGGGTWGNIIDVFHPLSDGKYVVCRFGHVSWLINPYEQPQVGDYVKIGQPVAKIGDVKNVYGITRAHLHWNISAPGNPIMIDKPNQWCGTNKACVINSYVDPIKFIVQMKKAQGSTPIPLPAPEQELPVTPVQYYVNNTSPGFTTANLRKWHSASAPLLAASVPNGTPVMGYDKVIERDGYKWRLIDYGKDSGWCVADKLSTTKPAVPA
jgi:murein DD-endopeptidase MepM/ murein hydrolase activator NlpD